MTKIQILVNEDNKFKLFTCENIHIQEPEFSLSGENVFNFVCTNVTFDDTNALISLPDEALARIQEYNINTEYRHLSEENERLIFRKEDLERIIRNCREELEFLSEELELYHQTAEEIIDEYPELAAEVSLKQGELDQAIWYMEQANKKGRKKK